MADEALNNGKILIVDDQEVNVALLQSILEQEGYLHLKSTTDSRQVLALYAEFQPDMILLDLMMPHLDGFAVMEQLRPLFPADSYLPILVLTADVTPEAKRRALSGGAKDFLTKPLDTVEVMLRVRNLLETRLLHLQLQNQNQILEKEVRERTAQLRESNRQLKLQLDHLEALRSIDRAIASSFDLRLTLNVVIDQVTTQLGVDAADVLLLNPPLQTLDYAAGRGFRRSAIAKGSLRLGEPFAGQAALERRTVAVSDLAQAPPALAGLIAGENFSAYFGVPLIVKGEVKGVLEVFHRAPLDPAPEWLNFLETLAGQAAIAIDNASLFDGLQRANTELILAYDATIEGWSRAMDLRDKETEGHTQRVTETTERLAQAMGVGDTEMGHLRRGALLHDMGKLGVPDGILLKPDKLTDEEWVIMKKHPRFAYEMLSSIAYLRPALDIPYCHHEKWDGTGYPRGLKGEQIPLAARIFAIVDVWDALRSDRPYRKGWPTDDVEAYLSEQVGKHFDPAVVEAFLKLVGSES